MTASRPSWGGFLARWAQALSRQLAARSVTVLDLATGDRGAIRCDCTPAGLVPMGNLLRLTEFGAGPLWLLDTGAADPRIALCRRCGSLARFEAFRIAYRPLAAA